MLGERDGDAGVRGDNGIGRGGLNELSLDSFDVVVVGAGPGGLAVSQQLGVRNISHVVLERGDCVGWMWHHVYYSLRLHTGKHLSSLPGMAFPAGTPLFPTREDLTEYLRAYGNVFELPVMTGQEVFGLRRKDSGWEIETRDAVFRSKAVVVATGIMSDPVIPEFEGMESYSGQIIHSTEYRRPDECSGGSVLVVGIGNSAAEIASELARAGRDVTLSVRSGANVIPRSIAGVPSQYVGWAMGWLPAGVQRRIVWGTGAVGRLLRRGPPGLPRKMTVGRCGDQPVIGRSILEHIEAGRVRVAPGVAEFNGSCVRFTDESEWYGDLVILATGFRAALGWMGDFGERDECGFADRRGRVRSAHHPDLYFVGQNYDGRGGLYNIRIDAQRIARLISGTQSQ